MNKTEAYLEAVKDPENLEKRFEYYRTLQRLGEKLPPLLAEESEEELEPWQELEEWLPTISNRKINQFLDLIEEAAQKEAVEEHNSRVPYFHENLVSIKTNGNQEEEIEINWKVYTGCHCHPVGENRSVKVDAKKIKDIYNKYHFTSF